MNTNDKKSLVCALETLIETAEKCRHTYFWSTDNTAGGRHAMERKYSVPEITWTEGGHDYTAEYIMQCSCAHVYSWGRYYKDGKKTTLTAIKNSYKRLVAEIS
jgi:hypothetical protein